MPGNLSPIETYEKKGSDRAMKKDIGVGVVGTGGIGKLVAMVLNKDNRTRLGVKSCCSLDAEVNRRHAEEWDIPHHTTEYREVLERDDIHIIGIYTPDQLHAGQTIQALHAGKHVVVTKPMVNTMEEVEQVVQAVRETGKKLLVGETYHFDNDKMAAKKLVDSGKIGDPIFIQSAYIHDMRYVAKARPWRLDPTNKIWPVGAMCHPIDLQLWFGGDVEEASAYANDGGTLEGREGDNNYIVNVKFNNGAIGRILGLYGIIHPPNPIWSASPFSVFCTKGSIVGTRYTVMATPPEPTPDQPHGVDEFDLEIESEDDNSYRSHMGSIKRYFLHMEDCILNDKQPVCNEIIGAKTTAIGWAIIESFQTGTAVKVCHEFESEVGLAD